MARTASGKERQIWTYCRCATAATAPAQELSPLGPGEVRPSSFPGYSSRDSDLQAFLGAKECASNVERVGRAFRPRLLRPVQPFSQRRRGIHVHFSFPPQLINEAVGPVCDSSFTGDRNKDGIPEIPNQYARILTQTHSYAQSAASSTSRWSVMRAREDSATCTRYSAWGRQILPGLQQPDSGRRNGMPPRRD